MKKIGYFLIITLLFSITPNLLADTTTNECKLCLGKELKQYLGAFDHAGISVKDMDKELSFYRDLLGFKVIAEGERSGKAIETIMGIKNLKLYIVQLMKDSSRIELIRFIEPSGETPNFRDKLADFRINHIAIANNNPDAVYRILKQAGVRMISKPQKIGASGAVTFYAYDPDGNIVEFVKWPKPSR